MQLQKPLLIYDGGCGFCRKWVLRLQKVTGNSLDYAPYQKAAQQFPQIPEEEFAKSVFLIEPDGTISRAAHAAFKALALSRWWGWVLWMYKWVPGFALMSEYVYNVVARNRKTTCVIHTKHNNM